MNHWIIKLRNIGRQKISRDVKITAKTLPEAVTKATKECKKHLMSKGVVLIHEDNLIYSVTAGFRSVGKVHIITA